MDRSFKDLCLLKIKENQRKRSYWKRSVTIRKLLEICRTKRTQYTVIYKMHRIISFSSNRKITRRLSTNWPLQWTISNNKETNCLANNQNSSINYILATKINNSRPISNDNNKFIFNKLQFSNKKLLLYKTKLKDSIIWLSNQIKEHQLLIRKSTVSKININSCWTKRHYKINNCKDVLTYFRMKGRTYSAKLKWWKITLLPLSIKM